MARVDFKAVRDSIAVFRNMGKTGNLTRPLGPAIEGAVGTAHKTANAKCDLALQGLLNGLGYKPGSKAIGQLNADGSYVVRFTRKHTATLYPNGEMVLVNNKGLTRIPAQEAGVVNVAAKPVQAKAHPPYINYHGYQGNEACISDSGKAKMINDVLTLGTPVRALADGKQLYRLETSEGVILAKVKDGKVTNMVTPFAKDWSGKHHQMTVFDFENATTRTFATSQNYYPQGNGLRDIYTNEPLEFFGDTAHTCFYRETRHVTPKGTKAILGATRVDDNGVVRDTGLRVISGTNYEIKRFNSFYRDLHGNVEVVNDSNRLALRGIKNTAGNVAYYTDGVTNYSIAEIADKVDAPVSAIFHAGKATIKLQA